MDLDRERERIQRGFDWYQDAIGEVVAWFEYDAAQSEYHHVYDEPTIGASTKWRPAIIVPVLWINEAEPDRVNGPSGQLITPSIRLAVSKTTLDEAGVSSPMDFPRHLNDLIVYRRTYWAVTSYALHGRLRAPTIIGITAARRNVDDDMPFDTLPALDGLEATYRPRGHLNDGFEDQYFPNHELPARHTP